MCSYMCICNIVLYTHMCICIYTYMFVCCLLSHESPALIVGELILVT